MGWTDYLRESLGSGIRGFFKNVQDELLTNIFIGLKKVEQHLLKELAAVLILVIGVALLAIACVYFLIDYLLLSRTIAFLTIGIIVLLVGVIIKLIK